MYLTIKRKESVSSILLFIFNLFLAERGILSIPLKKIFKILEPFQKNETAIRMGLSREIQNGLFVNKKENGEVYYELTPAVLDGFTHWKRIMDFNRIRSRRQLEAWDGHWHILLFTDADETREELVAKLRMDGARSINKNTWLSPYAIDRLLESTGLASVAHQSYLTFTGQVDQAKSPTEFVAKFWPVEDLQSRYQSLSIALDEAFEKLHPDQCSDGAGLPFLYRFGLELFEIAQDDPRLPLQLLPPDWLGLQVAERFQDIRTQLMPKAEAFIDRILQD